LVNDELGLEALPEIDDRLVRAQEELAEDVRALRQLHRLTLAELFLLLGREIASWAETAIDCQRRPDEEATPKRRGTL
jgi:hypothetical protein